MKIGPIALAASAVIVAPASAAGICDQITGTYVASRVGPFDGQPAHMAFDRLMLRAGLGQGNQVLIPIASQPTGKHVLLTTTKCEPLSPTQARVHVTSAVPGSAPYGGSNVIFTVYDGGARIWIKGEAPNPAYPGWLLRLPPPPSGG